MAPANVTDATTTVRLAAHFERLTGPTTAALRALETSPAFANLRASTERIKAACAVAEKAFRC